MAKTNWQDPKTSEIRSTHLSGLQEAVGKIEESIGMNTISEANIPLEEIFISNDDRCRIYQAPEGKRNWLLSPTPSIKKNGVIITDDFEIDYGGGAIIFTTPILESDILTADATYTVKIDGNQLSELGNKINQAEQKAKDYTDEQITLVTETGIPKLNVYEYKFHNVDIGTTEITIPLESFDKATDIVKLYINAIPRDSDFYTIDEKKIKLNKALEVESKVTIEVWKNIPVGEDGSVSGSVISIDSIPQNRVQGLTDLNEKINTIENGKVNKTGDKMTGNLDMDGKNVTIYAPETTGGWSNYFALRNKSNEVEMLFGMRGAGDIVDFSYIGNDTINNHLRFYTDKTQAMKPLEEVFTAISVSSQQEFDDTLNSISDSMPNNTYYKRVLGLTATIPKPMNVGGTWMLDGHKASSLYQWQKLISYIGDNMYFRTCSNGTWSNWSQIVTTRGGTFVGEVKHGRNLVTQPKLKDYSEINTILFPESNTVIDLSKGNVFELIPDKGVILSITNSSTTSPTNCHSFTLIITMQSPVYPITFPNSIKWVGDNPPDLTKPNREYYLTFVGRSGMSKWTGIFGGDTVVG
jgi:hypothetical protein